MSASLSEKILRWMGIPDKAERAELPAAAAVEGARVNNSSNVVSIHSNKSMKVVVFEPESFEEVQILSDHLKSRQEIILNMEHTSPEISQRIIDFVSGTTYSLEGHTHQIGKHIFVFTPSNIEITRDSRSIAVRRNPFYGSGGGNR